MNVEKNPPQNNNDNSNLPTPSQIIDNSSEIVKKEVDLYCNEYFDYKSVEWKSKFIGKNYDLVILILVIFLALIISVLIYIFSCKYCQYFYGNNYNKVLTGIIITISFSTLLSWFLLFGKTIDDLNKY